MPWVQKTTHAGKCIYIQRHYSSRYGSKNKCTRGSNYGKTSEARRQSTIARRAYSRR